MFAEGAPKGSAEVRGQDSSCRSSPLILLSGDQTRLLQEILLYHSSTVQEEGEREDRDKEKQKKHEYSVRIKGHLLVYVCVCVC